MEENQVENFVPEQENPQEGGGYEASGSGNKKIIWIVTGIVVVVLVILAAVYFVFMRGGGEGDVVLPGPANDDSGKKVIELPKRDGKISLELDGGVMVGDSFEVPIYMDTMDSNIVVASVVITYDEDFLEFVGKRGIVDTADSDMSMSIVNSVEDGRVEIVRGVPGDSNYLDSDDGFSGAKGLLANLEFKALKSGTTRLQFENEDSQLVLDDGRGTAMITELEDLVINIK